MTTLVIDATAILWMLAAIVWGWALGQIIVLGMVQRWDLVVAAQVRGWLSRIPLIADIRRRRQREEWNWWWATRTPEQMAEYRASVERTHAMMGRLTGVMADVGLSAEEASRSIAEFGRVYREAFEH